ncbi:MAG: type II toxin-antitoxin system Phd/YefM family antitoxin [Eggerthellaceae bacterium]|nr:type II toxin-antitoxin system Phd/YefM family antitoxin [Eggerthellaceae bacterium]
MAPLTIGFTEARRNLSKITDEVNRTGRPVTILKNSRPFVTISPVDNIASEEDSILRDALEAFHAMRDEARSRGFASEAEIEAEIAAVRAGRGKQ